MCCQETWYAFVKICFRVFSIPMQKLLLISFNPKHRNVQAEAATKYVAPEMILCPVLNAAVISLSTK